MLHTNLILIAIAVVLALLIAISKADRLFAPFLSNIAGDHYAYRINRLRIVVGIAVVGCSLCTLPVSIVGFHRITIIYIILSFIAVTIACTLLIKFWVINPDSSNVYKFLEEQKRLAENDESENNNGQL